MDHSKATELLERAAAELSFMAEGQGVNPRRAASVCREIEAFLQIKKEILKWGRWRLYLIKTDDKYRAVARCTLRAA